MAGGGASGAVVQAAVAMGAAASVAKEEVAVMAVVEWAVAG